MAKAFSPSVVTANDLLKGDVIYLDHGDGWTRDLARAAVFSERAEAEAKLAFAAGQPSIAVGAYLAPVTQGPDGPEPTHFREDFRRTGPSNYRHGKQKQVHVSL